MKKFVLYSLFLVLSPQAFAAKTWLNMENPLWIPDPGQIFSRTEYRRGQTVAPSVENLENNPFFAKGLKSADSFPDAFREEFGMGLTDRLSLSGRIEYTSDEVAGRSGISDASLSFYDRMYYSIGRQMAWDFYTEALFGDAGEMRGRLDDNGIKYEKWTHGEWAARFGTKFGKTWGDVGGTGNTFTAAASGDVAYHFSGDNTAIDVSGWSDFTTDDRWLPQTTPPTPDTGKSLATFGINPELGFILSQYWSYRAKLSLVYEISLWNFGFSAGYENRGEIKIVGFNADYSAVQSSTPTCSPGSTGTYPNCTGGYPIYAPGLAEAQLAFGNFESAYKGRTLISETTKIPLEFSAGFRWTKYIQFAVFGGFAIYQGGESDGQYRNSDTNFGIRLNARY